MGVDRKISRERLTAAPGPVYAETILEPSYAFGLTHYFGPLVETNQAWTVMLASSGVISRAEAAALLGALRSLEAEGPAALGEFEARYEYFYSHMERYLSDHVGEDVAGEINIGRTRPEPLARMVIRERLLDTLDALGRLRATFLELAEREVETVMPQWTHAQHAQPSSLGHYFLAVAKALERDHARLAHAYAGVNECTLGCGALAGSSYPLDRQLVADLLGFARVKENTIDCVAAADHLLETAAALATLMATLSRSCQDLYLWHTPEFDFVELGDEYSGSSSMMPQKKNPYPFEHVRSRAGHVVGEAMAAFATLHNVSFQDTKDVEDEVVYPVLRCFDLTASSLRLLDGALSSLSVKRERMRREAARGFAAATELAAVIHRGSPDLSYRTAHRIVGSLVRRAAGRGRDESSVDAGLLDEAAREVIGRSLDLDDGAVRAALDPVAFVAAHKTVGGPAPAEVRRSIASARALLGEHAESVGAMRDRRRDSRARLEARVRAFLGPG